MNTGVGPVYATTGTRERDPNLGGVQFLVPAEVQLHVTFWPGGGDGAAFDEIRRIVADADVGELGTIDARYVNHAGVYRVADLQFLAAEGGWVRDDIGRRLPMPTIFKVATTNWLPTVSLTLEAGSDLVGVNEIAAAMSAHAAGTADSRQLDLITAWTFTAAALVRANSTEAVAAALGSTHAAAAKRIQRARANHLLPRTTRGRATAK